jgi:hypothetical protein
MCEIVGNVGHVVDGATVIRLPRMPESATAE